MVLPNLSIMIDFMRTNIFPKISKGDLCDYLFALSVELDCICSACPDGDTSVVIANLSDNILNLSKNL